MYLLTKQLLLSFLFLSLLMWMTGAVGATSATHFVVTKVADTNDGVCNSDCSLREAISAANAQPGTDSISFALDGTFSLSLIGRLEDQNNSGDLDIKESLFIIGRGVGQTIIEGMGQDRVFDVRGGSAELHHLTIRHGSLSPTVETTANGGCIRQTGFTTLTLDHLLLTNCVAQGIFAHGGAIYSSGSLIIRHTEIAQSHATTIDPTSGTGYGGGLYLLGVRTGFNAEQIYATTFAANSASSAGGAILFSPRDPTGAKLLLSNSTISGNQAPSGAGLSLWNQSPRNAFSHLNLVNSTIAENVASQSSGVGGVEIVAVPQFVTTPTILLQNSVIAQNSPRNCHPDRNHATQGVSVASDGSCDATTVTAGSVLFAPLSNDGGPTRTHLPLAGTVLIDSADCPTLVEDQRGILRPQGTRCDVGAVEQEQITTAPVSFTVQTTPSRTVLPPTGGYVEYTLTVTNTSDGATWQDPLQVTRYVDALLGEIAPNPLTWESDCYWWLPKLWPTQSWSCHINLFVAGQPIGTTKEVQSVVYAVSELGSSLKERSFTTIQFAQARGVSSPAYWATHWSEATSLLRPIDFDQDGTLDQAGFLIGDWNFNGKCDLYELWWSRQCIALTPNEAQQLIQASSSSSYRLRLGSSLLATWLNLLQGNDFQCANLDVVINLSNQWLYRWSADGNPLDSGTTPTEADWQQFSWAYDWLNWYNETGGQNCARPYTSQGALTFAHRSAEPFEPFKPFPFAQFLSPQARREYGYVLSADATLRNDLHALYRETTWRVLRNQPISADFLSRAEAIFQRAISSMSPDARDEFLALWGQLNLTRLTGQEGRVAWAQLEQPLVPTAVRLATNPIQMRPISPLLFLGVLSLATLFFTSKRA